MRWFGRGILAVGALALPFALTGCGERQAGADVARPAPDVTTAVPVTALPSHSSGTPEPGASGDATSDGGGAFASYSPTYSPAYSPRPETALPDVPPNHVDNRGFLKTADLTPAAKAAGEDTARRVRTALQPLVGATPYQQEQFREKLAASGVPGATVTAGAESVVFSGSLPAGGCLSGSVYGGVLKTEVHGMYLEGGCERPRGGH